MHAASALARASALRKGILSGVILNAALIGYGLIRVPTSLEGSGVGSVGAAIGVLLLYGLIGVLGTRPSGRAYLVTLRQGTLFGAAVGVVFIVQILVEYLAPLSSEGDGRWALITFGAVLVLFFFAAVGGSYRTGRVGIAVLSAVWCALAGSLIWFNVLLMTHYAFMGTPQQEHFLDIDQTYADYRRSGMHDLQAFVMQDYLGGGFFHLLLSPIVAALFGAVGGPVGKGLAVVRAQLRTRK